MAPQAAVLPSATVLADVALATGDLQPWVLPAAAAGVALAGCVCKGSHYLTGGLGKAHWNLASPGEGSGAFMHLPSCRSLAPDTHF